MTTPHTTGRLAFRENGDANSYALVDDDGNWLMSLLHNGQQLTDTQRENMRRLVACWNACEGLTTEQLERQSVRLRDDALIQFKPGGEILSGSKNAVERASAIVTQRDDLLVAITALLNDPAVIEAAQPGDIGRALMATREDFLS